MKLLQLLLRIQKSLRHRVVHELLPQHLKLRHLVHRQFESLALPHPQQVANAVDLLILEFQQLVAHEGVEFLFQGAKIVLFDDGLAEVQRALRNRAFFGFGIHGRGDDSGGFSAVQRNDYPTCIRSHATVRDGPAMKTLGTLRERATVPTAPKTPCDEPLPNARIWFVGLLVALGALSWSLFSDFAAPWTDQIDANGACWSQSAHNTLRAGLLATAGVPSAFYFGILPIPPEAYYTHPSTAVIPLAHGMFSLLGEKEWVARLLPITCSLLGVVLLWSLVKECASARAAAFCVLAFAAMPMECATAAW